VVAGLGRIGFVAIALRGAGILATPLDQGSCEACCQPLARETVARTHPWPRCNDPVRFVGGVVLLIGGAGVSILLWLSGRRTDARRLEMSVTLQL